MRLAWSLWGVQATLCTLALTFLVMHGFQVIPSMSSGGIEVLLLAATLAIATVGALIASRRPGNPIGWVFSGVATGMSLFLCTVHYVIYDHILDAAVAPATRVLAWLADTLAPAAVFLGMGLLFLLFPEGRLASSRWRPVLWLAALGTAMTMVSAALAPGPMRFMPLVANPFGIEAAAEGLSALGGVGMAVALLGVGGAAVSLVFRFRSSAGVERQQ
ncbi:MAG: hypothetical protein M3O70_22910, partial [Actinomycetota bacterium]|nr:hypothetical protein [Actinomycetota bacterium]